MEDSKAHQKIIELGKTIVKELELDPGVDTLAKWMAHYVAEKIELAEKLSGKKKKLAQEKCFEIILKLWKHRWSALRGNSFLRDFEPLFDTLEKLNPNREPPFFFSTGIQPDFNRENGEEDSNQVNNYLDAALRVDRIARSIIYDLLHQAVSGLKLTENREKLIRNASDLIIDYPDTRIIKFISYNDDDVNETKERINELMKRIKELEEFDSLKDSLLAKYNKELNELQNGQ